MNNDERKQTIQNLKDLVEFLETRIDKLHFLVFEIFNSHITQLIDLKEQELRLEKYKRENLSGVLE